MAKITTKLDPLGKRYSPSEAADELARLTELRDEAEELIGHLKNRILKEIGTLDGEHTPLIGKLAAWDIRNLPTATVAWKQVALAAGASAVAIEASTTHRHQISFKRLPKEVNK
jgi:hypothetical protein